MNATFTLSLAPLMVSAAQPATFRKSRRRVETWAMPSVVTGFIAYTDVDEDFYRIPSPGSRQSALEPAGRTPRRAAASARGALHCRRSGGDSLTPPRARRIRDEDTFDGKTLNGWSGSPDWWSVEDGAIVGKSSGRVPTSFLFTKDNYTDFRLTVSSKMVDSENHAGVCFWGEVIEEGTNKWNTRGPLVIFPIPSMWDYIQARALRVYYLTTEKVTAQHDWVKVEILAQGNRVRSAFNGVEIMEWREPDPNRIKVGPIGMQLHGFNGEQKVLYKDIVVETFPRKTGCSP